ELSDGQVVKLVGTTKPTIEKIRARTHWDMANIKPTDPVSLGLCSQTSLDREVAVARKRMARKGQQVVSPTQPIMDTGTPEPDLP
ncbi:MAG: DUF1013 domain-containing protein, partial [Alphaproteobacteria bacterium]|nr:DUF1013 domain-containing protein [Alphaproteobacteria bacterium]